MSYEVVKTLYCFGFQVQEKDNEIYCKGNANFIIKVKLKFGQPGGGSEWMTEDKVQIRIINYNL
jgi:hypothetical protein